MVIRVRFAPSPTGLLHIGNARTAVINWLPMRHAQLKGEEAHFLLRMDDTDLERSKDEYAQAIQTDLAWLGLTHDNFFRQSERFGRYLEIMQELISRGRLYACYETPEELEFKRKRQLSRGEPPIYDRSALKITQAEKQSYEQEGRRPYWRFLLQPKEIVWEDLVRGQTEFHGARLSDPVLVRADGAFLYTITSVIDDIDHKITHVLRGEDHVTNTAVQIQLFEAIYEILGSPPEPISFGHTTLLLDQDGSPLSKRLGSLSLTSLREEGVEPMAINSLLARLGTSQPIETKLTLDELAADFDLSHFSRTPPRFDRRELESMNRKLFQITPYGHVKDRLENLGIKKITESLWLLIRGNLKTLKDVLQWQHILFGYIHGEKREEDYLKVAIDLLPPLPWKEDTWSHWTSALKEKTGRKGKELFMPLRQAITGFDHGPEMKDLLPIIGREKVLRRLGG